MKCKRCNAMNPRGSRSCWACGVNLRKGRTRLAAFKPEAMRFYNTSSVAIGDHHAWVDGLVLLSTIMFGLMLGYFLLDILPKSVAGAAAARPTFTLPSVLSFLSPSTEVRPPVPFGGAQEVQGVVAQAADPRRTKSEGGRQATAGNDFLAVTLVVDNQGKQPLSYNLSDLKVRDAKGRSHTAENIRGAGWLSGGTLEPGQRVQGAVAFLIPEGDPQPQLSFSPSPLRTTLRWGG